MKHNIVFRIHKKEGYLTAVFFDQFADLKGNLTCYAHIGQHGSCCPLWLYHDTRPATPEEYRTLLNELTGVYHDEELVIHNKLPRFDKTISTIKHSIKEYRQRTKR